jgi:hypothetical protein
VPDPVISCDSGSSKLVLWFMTRFESRGDHGCEEQCHARDMRFYTGSNLGEDKNRTSCVRWCIIIRWVETPSTPPFIC